MGVAQHLLLFCFAGTDLKKHAIPQGSEQPIVFDHVLGLLFENVLHLMVGNNMKNENLLLLTVFEQGIPSMWAQVTL